MYGIDSLLKLADSALSAASRASQGSLTAVDVKDLNVEVSIEMKAERRRKLTARVAG